MGKTRHWLLLAFGSLVILAAGASAAQATSLVEHNAIPNVEQRWSSSSFSTLLESGGPPEFGRCIKTTGGAYEDSGCTTTGTGKSYEWYSAFGSSQPLEKTGFSNVIKEGTTAMLETVNKNLVTCEGESAAGKYTGNKTVGSVVVTFTGCSSFGTSCKSEGAAAGTVVTYPLEGVLGVEEVEAQPVNDKIGQSLFPAGHSGPFAELNCGGALMSISGSIITPVTTNSMKVTAQSKTKAAKGKQRPEAFAGGPTEVLMTTIEGGSPEQGGETLTTIQANEEKLEINSVL